ncbi:MAG: hypothetical protein AAF998_17495 [Bacteroidota bacterium]
MKINGKTTMDTDLRRYAFPKYIRFYGLVVLIGLFWGNLPAQNTDLDSLVGQWFVQDLLEESTPGFASITVRYEIKDFGKMFIVDPGLVLSDCDLPSSLCISTMEQVCKEVSRDKSRVILQVFAFDFFQSGDKVGVRVPFLLREVRKKRGKCHLSPLQRPMVTEESTQKRFEYEIGD